MTQMAQMGSETTDIRFRVRDMVKGMLHSAQYAERLFENAVESLCRPKRTPLPNSVVYKINVVDAGTYEMPSSTPIGAWRTIRARTE